MLGEYIVLVRVDVGSVEEPPKKKRVLVMRRRRTARDGGATLVAKTLREGARWDEIARGEAVPSVAGPNSDGGVDHKVVLSSVGERATGAPEEPVPKVEEPEEGEEEDKVPLAQRTGRSRLSAQAVLAGMQTIVRTADPTYVPSGTPLSVDITVSEVRSETSKWNGGLE